MSCLLRAGIGSEEETVHDSTPDAHEGGLRFGVYEIDCREDGRLYELGRGAMGVTYRATDTTLQRKVALKIIQTDIAERSADARERFMREARAAAALRHENIATVYQFGTRLETGQYFYAMELIEGETLDERVRRAGPLDARTTIEIAQQVTSALATAEKHGLVHRDLKPANLMLVSPDGETGNNKKLLVKIIDFGLAKAINSQIDPKSLTHDRFVGTPAFASPEQFEHSSLDVRSDIYSLGETLWFALTGKTPFSGRTMEEIRRAQKSNVLPMEQLKAAHVPHRLKSLLESMLALEPASRPSTHELATRLKRCSPEERSVRRTRVAFVTAALLVFGMSALFVFRSSRTPNAVLNAAPDKSIAVLPFENLSRDPDNAYFATGIQDEILTRLAKIASLKVISHNSTQQYAARPGNLPEIARQLGVANILEGSVQKTADQVHINVQLIRAATDEHLWAESYDRKLENMFAVEAEVATAVADALKAKLTGAEQKAIERKPTNNPEAYDAYLRGIALYRGDNFIVRLKAVHELEEAVRVDPNFTVAWALLARANSLAFTYNAAPARRAAAQQSLETALRLQPDLSEVQLAQAFYQLWVLRDYNRAREGFQSLRQKLPNSPDIPEALYLISVGQGRWEEARVHTEESIALSPLDRLLRLEAAYVRRAMRNFSTALKYYDEALKIWPDDPVLLADKTDLYQALGELDQADALLAKLHPTTQNIAGLSETVYQAILRRRPASAIPLLQGCLDNADSWDARSRLYFRILLGDLQRLGGDAKSANTNYSQVGEKAEEMLKEHYEYTEWIYNALAETYAGLGDRNRALGSADRAISLTPSTANALRLTENRARIAARFGVNDLAIPALERLLKAYYGDPLTPALLRLDPDFDQLRNDPRFQKLCEEKQP
jgi:serine/threonine protein kinase/predicted Zn-dependent protease